MAEHSLYSNTAEPHFPFEKIRPQLSWLPEYLSTSISDLYLDEPLLNTVLVFTRARTATLLSSYSLEEVKQFTRRLNEAAESVGASHHQLELFPLYGMYFVTCRRSPRFQWILPMTHHDIGRNLDYFAPGHLTTDPNAQRCFIFFVEKTRLRAVTAEAVLVKSLEDESVHEVFRKYNQTREDLFNTSMKQLGLPYEFKCVVMMPDGPEHLASVMANPSPPPSEWWDENCYLLNGFVFPGVLVDHDYNFCSYKTKYNLYWPLIQQTFHFVISYKRYEYCHGNPSYAGSVKDVLRRVKDLCEKDSVEDFDAVFAEIKESFRSLEESAVKTGFNIESIAKRGRKPEPSWQHRLRCVLYSITRIVYMYIFEPFKLRRRLVRECIDYPPLGDEVVFY
jgi:hypothetical protein